MSFPNFKNKHAHDSIINPKEYMQYAKRSGRLSDYKAPEAIIVCYSNSFFKDLAERYKAERHKFGRGNILFVKNTKNKIAVYGESGVGASNVVACVEELIAFGVKKFISLGVAGALQKKLKHGDIVVCDKAIRDEGTSHHYLKPSKYAYASKELTKQLIKSLEKRKKKYVVGTSWTIDAPYRETIAEAKRYQKEGVATVEMEASALFALAQYRKVKMGSIFAISDSLAEFEWKPKFWHKRTRAGLETAYEAALDILKEP